MKPGLQVLAALVLLCACAAGVGADEIKLKDGSKIIGVIVGFEDNSFRVKTGYGYALIQKDQVVSISVVDDKRPEPAARPDAKVDESPAPPKPASAEVAHEAPATASGSPAGSGPNKPGAKTTTSAAAPKPAATTSGPPPAGASGTLTANPGVNAATPGATANAKTSTTPGATGSLASASSPSKVEPEPVREEVSGNTYANRTWGFQMYKPPDWQVIDSARGMLPGAIMAMGTSDQRTYLLIGQEAAGKSLTSDMDAIEGRLREVVENYRLVSEKRVTIAGVTAVQHKFRGSIDNHDWSGVIVFIPRDSHLYTVFGMTYADSDLVQIQENVISRAISSLQFTKQ